MTQSLFTSSVPARAVATAHPNIALAKYWGKQPFGHNLPAVPSLSVTLEGMATRTEVTFSAERGDDLVELNGRPASGRPRARVLGLLDLVRDEAARLFGRSLGQAEVRSVNDFPTAAGLASSASAFSALALAARAAAGLEHGAALVSDAARRASVSAARSALGGYVSLAAGRPGDEALAAEPVAPADHLDLVVQVAVTAEGEKEVSSTDGMRHTSESSAFYSAWVESAPALYEEVRAAIVRRDLEVLALAAEASALRMHASALAARPFVLYWNPTTVAVLREVAALRRAGTFAFFTIDAGPHVKVFTRAAEAGVVRDRLRSIPSVLRVLEARPGQGARLEPGAPLAGSAS
jgi:diphosphomevalonate decarboxylase